MDDETYQDIKDDTVDECSKFGNVTACFIPRPHTPSLPSDDHIGMVFVAFETEEAAMACRDRLQGRKFDGKSVSAKCIEPVVLKKIYPEWDGGSDVVETPAGFGQSV